MVINRSSLSDFCCTGDNFFNSSSVISGIRIMNWPVNLSIFTDSGIVKYPLNLIVKIFKVRQGHESLAAFIRLWRIYSRPALFYAL